MKTPAPLPSFIQAFKEVGQDLDRLVHVLGVAEQAGDRDYLTWDKIRFKQPPSGLTHEDWWFAIKMGRRSALRPLPLTVRGEDGDTNLKYALPDRVLRALDNVANTASGQIALPSNVLGAASNERFVIASLIEESISSSQLEGASTSRRVAKDMLVHNKQPRTLSEQMIVNNYRAMQHVREIQDQDFTPEAICEIHRIVTDQTPENPDAAGQIQADPDPADRVKILDEHGKVLHSPPPAVELPGRLQALCDFANAGPDADPYVPPVVRALAIHFMAGYDHYFEDGNGRTVRVLFYWSMLKQGYWLTEHLAISNILRKAPSKYARSFIHTEQDDGDLTYFLVYHLAVIQRAIEELDAYLLQRSTDIRRVQAMARPGVSGFNYRQAELLESAVRNPTNYYTVDSHSGYHGVSKQTARNDLYELERRELLERTKLGRQFAWVPKAGLLETLQPSVPLWGE
ncbi:Fic family protein [Tomitella biformata]|uniref:Fic family protein n=1 Tax=Tomitella biformata TaxID=630403 RepID=UPI0004657950|nr:Fic family protein [Tomitella biformata]